MNIFADNCLNLQPSRSELRPYRNKEIISRIGHNLCRVLIQDLVPVTHPVIPKKPFWVRPGNISEVSNLTSFQTALGASLRSINGPSGVWSHRVCSVLCHGSSKESLLGNKIWFWTLFSTTQRLHKPLNHIIGPLKTPG